MARNRLTKEELEQDPLIETYNKVQNFYEEHKTVVLTSIISFILVVGLGIGYYYYSQSQEQQAQQLMTNAEEHFLNGQYELALQGSEQELTIGFEQIINNYSRTDAANLARYYAAVCHFYLGNTQDALSYMESYEAPEGIMGVAPLSFHGVLLTEMELHEEAANKYLQAAEWDQNESTTPYNLLESANAFMDAGNRARARELTERIIDEYPDSPQAEEANRLNGLLTAKANSAN